MKRLALGLCLLVPLFNASTNAEDKRAAGDDSSTVQATVRDYIEAYYTGDAHRMEQTLHPQYLKHLIHGSIPMREKTGVQMVQEVRSKGVPVDIPSTERTE
jgi:hypothetical protein